MGERDLVAVPDNWLSQIRVAIGDGPLVFASDEARLHQLTFCNDWYENKSIWNDIVIEWASSYNIHLSLPLGNTALGGRWVNILISDQRPRKKHKRPLCACPWRQSLNLNIHSTTKEWHWFSGYVIFSYPRSFLHEVWQCYMLIALVSLFHGTYTSLTLNICSYCLQIIRATARMRVTDDSAVTCIRTAIVKLPVQYSL